MFTVLFGRTLGAGSGTTVFAINVSESSTQTPMPPVRIIIKLSTRIYHPEPVVTLQKKVPPAVGGSFLYVKLRT